MTSLESTATMEVPALSLPTQCGNVLVYRVGQRYLHLLPTIEALEGQTWVSKVE